MSLHANNLKKGITNGEFNNLKSRKFVIKDQFDDLLMHKYGFCLFPFRAESLNKLIKSRNGNIKEEFGNYETDTKVNKSLATIQPIYKIVPKTRERTQVNDMRRSVLIDNFKNEFGLKSKLRLVSSSKLTRNGSVPV